jgi:hypothetical protein
MTYPKFRTWCGESTGRETSISGNLRPIARFLEHTAQDKNPAAEAEPMAQPPTDDELKAVDAVLGEWADACYSFERLAAKNCPRVELRTLLAKILRSAHLDSFSREDLDGAATRLKQSARLLARLANWDDKRFAAKELWPQQDAGLRLERLSQDLNAFAAAITTWVQSGQAGENKHIYLDKKKADLVRFVKQNTGQLNDADVASVVAAMTDNQNFGPDAHRKWRERNSDLLAAAEV